MIRKISNYYKEYGLKMLLNHINNYFRNLITPFLMSTIEMIKSPEKKIVFCNFAGKGYGGYPKEICDELIRRKTDAQLIWLVNKDVNDLPEQVKSVRIYSYSEIWELATAKIWIDNCRKSSRLRKSKKQFYLQTWHSGGPGLKMSEGDASEYLTSSYIKDAKHDTEMADLFISDCEWQNQTYRRSFWYQGEILNCTTPPNDVFYQDWAIVKRRVYDYFGFKTETRVILYAPTFRNNHSLSCYNIDYNRLIDTCRRRFGGEWVVIIRMHPTMSEQQDRIIYNDKLFNGTSYPQIEELLVAAEIFISDFSASMFSAFKWKIKTFLYADDYDEYIQNERPLYFDLNELPANFSKTNDELFKSIESFSEDEYEMRCDLFSKTVGFFEGGQSVRTITNRIEEELNRTCS